MNEKSKCPCADCEKDETLCNRQGVYLRCYKWRKWIRDEWSEIRKSLGINVSIRHEEKGGDDK